MSQGRDRLVHFAVCVWAVAFGAPHLWWVLGSSFGFPGGETQYQVMVTSLWRYVYDMIVVALSIVGAIVALMLVRGNARPGVRRVLLALSWAACVLLSLRGIAGMFADGLSDLVWWPTFLIGGVLFGAMASSGDSQNAEISPGAL